MNMAESSPVQEEGVLADHSSVKAEESSTGKLGEEKQPSVSKDIESTTSSISKEAGSKKLTIAKNAESEISLKKVESKKSTTSKTLEGDASSAENKDDIGMQNSRTEIGADDSLSLKEDGIIKKPFEDSSSKDGLKEAAEVCSEGLEAGEEVEDKEDEEYEEVEEDYEDEVEEDGIVKTITKQRTVKVPKLKEDKLKGTFKEDQKYDESEEEEIHQNGKKMLRKSSVYEEQEEEYETEEENEDGTFIMVKKTRIVKVPLRKTIVKPNSVYSEDAIEDYEEEIVNEAGEKVIIKQKRIVRMLRGPSAEPPEAKKSEGGSKEIEEEESVEEEEESEEEDVEEEEEEEEKEGRFGKKGEVGEIEKIPTEKKKRRRKKKKIEEGVVEGGEETGGHRKKRKKRVEKVESLISFKSKVIPSEQSREEEEGTEEVLGEEEEEEGEAIKSLTSEELRQAEEKAVIAQKFESLTKLRSEHLALRKRTFFLTSKLMQYFRKQKMDHLLSDVKVDPEMEERLKHKLVEFHDCNQRMTEEKAKISMEWEAQRTVNENLAMEMKQMLEELMAHKKEVTAKLIDPRTGRAVQHDKVLEDLLNRQEQQMKLLSECRLNQIKLRRQIEAKKAERQTDNMGEDFRLMDYEKLASLKEYYIDKITERDIEIGEVKDKIAMMEDNLHAITEQLKCREEEMEQEQLKLHLITTDLNTKRENLNQIKTMKHKTEKNTTKVKQQSGLLAYPTLLKDYEEKSQQLKEMKTESDKLKHQYNSGLDRICKLKETVKKKTAAKRTLFSSLESP